MASRNFARLLPPDSATVIYYNLFWRVKDVSCWFLLGCWKIFQSFYFCSDQRDLDPLTLIKTVTLCTDDEYSHRVSSYYAPAPNRRGH